MDARVAHGLRLAMVASQIEKRGVRDPAVLHAMRSVPRHRFVPERQRAHAYEDRPLPIGQAEDGAVQTISQPYMVAAMTEALRVGPGDRVLEVGTGCGYQAAVLAEVVSEVVSVEIVPTLARSARERLERLCYRNVTVCRGDGAEGWPELAPYQGILVACGAPQVPPALLEQLESGRRLVIPVGEEGRVMQLELWEKSGQRAQRTGSLMPVRFVPLRAHA